MSDEKNEQDKTNKENENFLIENNALKKEIENLQKQVLESQKKEDNLNIANKTLEEQRKILGLEKKEFEQRETEHQQKLEDFFKEKNKLNKREQRINQLEVDAENNFANMREKILGDLNLKDEIKALEQKKVNLEKGIDKDISQMLADAENTRDQGWKKFYASLNNSREKLLEEMHKALENLIKEQVQLHQETQELKKQELDLENSKALLGIQKEKMEEVIKQKYSYDIDSLKNQLSIAEMNVDNYKDDVSDLREKLSEVDKFKSRLQNRTPQEILQYISRMEKKMDGLNEELALKPSWEEIDEFEVIQKEITNLKDINRELSRENNQLKIESSCSLVSVTELESLREQLKISNLRIEQCKTITDSLEEELQKYKSLNSLTATREARIGVIDEPIQDLLCDKNQLVEEQEDEWIENIKAKMEESGFVFYDRLLKAFHTSLKIAEWSPLTVLAGVSGTGKSELPRLYSRFGGIQFCPVAVQPSWDSQQDMFGFFNYLENRFNPKPILRAMVQSQREAELREGFRDGLLLILLDEMNLAKVEQYFSDLLSKLELRRGEKKVLIDIDLGSGLDNYGLELGRNILYTGTMNEDESTTTLSDKTIDRSNVISFPSPKSFHQRDNTSLATPCGFLKFKTWQSWQDSPASIPQVFRNKYKTIIEDINERMRLAGRAVGHRVWQSMENYIVNHPDVCSLKDVENREENEDYKKAVQRAFEDQLVQKIMPKLRGVETEGPMKNECIEPISKIIKDIAPGLEDDFKIASDKGYGIFLWNSSRYLESDS